MSVLFSRRYILILLIVLGVGRGAYALTLMTWNVSGSGAADWSTNAAQVQAIGRQVAALNADIITFNGIPQAKTYEMTNFVSVWLPGYYLATNSGTDNLERSVIASRYPITRSQSWLSRSNLSNFGYSGVFSRDLFEAEVRLPGTAEPLHVFTLHLKGTYFRLLGCSWSSNVEHLDSRMNRRSAGSALGFPHALERWTTGLPCFRASSTVFLEPLVRISPMEKTAVPSESRTFHPVRWT